MASISISASVLKIRAEVNMQSAGAGYMHSLEEHQSQSVLVGVPCFDTTASWRSVRSLYGWGNIDKSADAGYMHSLEEK